MEFSTQSKTDQAKLELFKIPRLSDWPPKEFALSVLRLLGDIQPVASLCERTEKDGASTWSIAILTDTRLIHAIEAGPGDWDWISDNQSGVEAHSHRLSEIQSISIGDTDHWSFGQSSNLTYTNRLTMRFRDGTEIQIPRTDFPSDTQVRGEIEKLQNELIRISNEG